MLQPANQAVADGVFQPRMVEYGGINESGKRGLFGADLLGFAPHVAPDGVVTLDVRLGREWLGHGNLNSFAYGSFGLA